MRATLAAKLALPLSLALLAACAIPGPRKATRVSGERLVRTARSQIGKPYRFGGCSPKKGFDCSGLVWWVHRRHGVMLPRSSRLQFKGGRRVRRKHLSPGDLLFFKTKKSVSHVGIYTGRGTFIHAPSSGKSVRESRLNNPYWKKRYLGAKRYH